MMPSVVHNEAWPKCAFLNLKSIPYNMLFTGVVHRIGLTFSYINIDFKTVLQFMSSFYYPHNDHETGM